MGDYMKMAGRPKTYDINEEYFNNPLTNIGAYFLGLIISDGHLNYKRGVFQYACKIDDVELIRFIKSELHSTHPIKEYKIKKKWYVRYNITNKKLVSSLIEKYNLPHSNKSENNVDIPNISEGLISHFLRGLFDGDGSIWKSKNESSYAMSYTGGEKMMLSIQNILNTFNIKSRISYKYGLQNKNSCNIGFNGNLKVSKFLDFLYKDADFYLKRKHDRYVECKKLANEFINHTFDLNGNSEKIKIMYSEGLSQKNISKKLGLVYSSVRCCVQRLRKNKEII